MQWINWPNMGGQAPLRERRVPLVSLEQFLGAFAAKGGRGGDDENDVERYGNVEGVGSNTCAILCKSKGCYCALLPQTG